MTARRIRRPAPGPFRRRWPRWLAILILALMAIRGLDALLPRGVPDRLEPGAYTVDRVVDGDTLLLANGARVRLIGTDTPETVKPDHPVEPFGPEATEFTRRLIEHNEGRVRIELDGPSKDRHDRFLAVVWVGDRMLNEELLRAGLARLRAEFPFSPPLKHRLRAARDEAKEADRGIHGPLPAPRADKQARAEARGVAASNTPAMVRTRASPACRLAARPVESGLLTSGSQVRSFSIHEARDEP